MNILLVDDQIWVLSGMRQGIHWEKLGIDRVFTAGSAAEARQILVNEKVDLLMLDIEMPQESGISLAHWVRSKGLEVEILFLTSHAEFEYAREAVSLEAVDYILQPARYEVIEKAVEKMIQRFEKRAGNRENIKTNEAMPHEGEAVTNDKVVWQKNALSHEKEMHGQETTQNTSATRKLTDQAIVFIRNNLDKKITRKDVADYVHLNEDYLTRIFKENTGWVLKNYINNEKIRFAKELLLTTNMSVSVIALKTGFQNFSHFSQNFRKVEGISPSEYREQHLLKKSDFE